MLKIVLLVTGVAALLLSFIPSLRTEATPFLQHPDAIYLAILGLINLLFAPVLQSSHPTRPLQAGAAALLVLGVVLQALILLAPLPTIADQPAIVLPLLSLVLATALQLAGSLKPGKPVSRSASAPAALGGSQDSGNRETGTVKWFNTSKGFGFISRDSGEDIFVHFRAIRGEGHRILIEGQRVEFSVVQRDKGLGLLRKLMFRFEVTAISTAPRRPRMTAYIAASASAMMVGPDSVPPGRTSLP